MPSSGAIHTTKPLKQIVKIYSDLGGYIDGTIPDRYGAGRTFWGTLAEYIYSKIHHSYSIRSEGGIDDLGNKFKPLKKSTIARRPLARGDVAKTGISGLKNRTRGLLTESQDHQWKKLYFAKLHRLKLFFDESTAKKIAAAHAWEEMKSKGAQTKLEVLGSRDVLIMRVTDEIYKSLTPSTLRGDGLYVPRKNQIFETTNGKLKLGTEVEHAKFHNNTRPVIPRNYKKWVNEGIKIAFKAAVDKLTDSVRK